jgi:putative GTP pyrophosphokinase
MSESKQSLDDEWFERIVPLHGRLTDVAIELVRNLVESNDVEYLSVTGRTKDTDSIKEKIRRKDYKTPRIQMTDISGIRVITYLESQVEKIISIVREAFEIDEDNSLDRKQILGSDKVGYRSAHFVCTLGDIRSSLLEYRDFRAFKFEIQVRTVLQHAWAELAHDRSFKFSPGLPQGIQRKFNLYSGNA